MNIQINVRGGAQVRITAKTSLVAILTINTVAPHAPSLVQYNSQNWEYCLIWCFYIFWNDIQINTDNLYLHLKVADRMLSSMASRYWENLKATESGVTSQSRAEHWKNYLWCLTRSSNILQSRPGKSHCSQYSSFFFSVPASPDSHLYMMLGSPLSSLK